MRTITSALVLLAILTGVAQARMYQWTSPDSGTVQLSGQPPAWYRARAPGPRVLVFDNGELIDDTRVEVSDQQREALRALAFDGVAASELSPGTSEAAALRSELKAVLEKAQEQGIDVDAVAEELHHEQAAEAEVASETVLDDKVATLKALIEVWDQRQLERARAILDALPATEEPAAAVPPQPATQ